MLNKLIMICYFWESLKPSIKVEIGQQDRESINFEEMVQKAINAEAKASLKSTIMIQDSEICCFQGYCSSNNIAPKMQTQETTAKDFFRSEELQIKNPKSALLHNNIAEPAKKKNKQKKFKRQQERIKEPKNTSATGNNIVNTTKKKKKRDTTQVMCFNYNKKGHYISNCTEQKN